MNAIQHLNKAYKKKNLLKIYQEEISTKHSIGLDRITSTLFEKKLNDEIAIIKRKVRNGSYRFTVYREKLITKGPNNSPRVISIPTIRDKLTLKTLHHILMDIYGKPLEHKSAQSMIRKVKQTIDTGCFDAYIKLDIQGFYSSIDHPLMIQTLKNTIQEEKIIQLITQAITQNTASRLYKNTQKNTNNVGLPQGLSISGTLANIYLLEMDRVHGSREDYAYFRYVDDILIFCQLEATKSILENITKDFNALELKVHPAKKGSEKTSYGTLDMGFTFLGHTFNKYTVSIRSASTQKLEDSIVKLFTDYKYRKDKKYLYQKLNLRITGGTYDGRQFGWLYFFSNINDLRLLFKLDHFVKRLFIKFEVPYYPEKIKKFSRTYYEIRKNNPNSNYIPRMETYSYKQKKQLLRLSPLQKIQLNLMKKEQRKSKIKDLFKIEIKKERFEVKKEIGIYYH